MDVYTAILKRRSIRKFKTKKIPLNLLKQIINCARFAPSAANLQPLEFFVITDKKLLKSMLKYTRWAAYLRPEEKTRYGYDTVAYIAIFVNVKCVAMPEAALRDIGAAAENIMLFAQSKGIASCWLGAIDKKGIEKLLDAPKHLKIDSVIALGYPAMKSYTAPYNNSVKYYLDSKGILCVPKKPLQKILHINKF